MERHHLGRHAPGHYRTADPPRAPQALPAHRRLHVLLWLVPYEWRLPFAIRIHHIMRPDADPYLHDHPWAWRTIVLRGWYLEEDVFGTPQLRRAGETRAASAETLHRIDRVSEGGVWTLFITGRKCNAWGFVVPGNGMPRKVYHQNYISENGRGELHGEPVRADGGVQ